MEKIKAKAFRLRDGQWCYVSPEWFDYVTQWEWSARNVNGKYYAVRFEPNGTASGHSYVHLHNVILTPPSGKVVDHKDRNGLNNVSSNLRIATQQQNTINRPGRAKSGIKGVYWGSRVRKWFATISIDKKRIQFGYNTKQEAVEKRAELENEFYKEFAYTENVQTIKDYEIEYVEIDRAPKGLRGMHVQRGVIPLTNNQHTYVDDGDWDWLIQYMWQAIWSETGWYVQGVVDGKITKMHRLITGVQDPSLVVDHSDHNTLNNRRDNLVVRHESGNRINQRKRKDNNTGYVGVNFEPKNQRYWCEFVYLGKRYRDYWFDNPEDAAKARDKLAMRYGEGKIYLNFPEEWGE